MSNWFWMNLHDIEDIISILESSIILRTWYIIILFSKIWSFLKFVLIFKRFQLLGCFRIYSRIFESIRLRLLSMLISDDMTTWLSGRDWAIREFSDISVNIRASSSFPIFDIWRSTDWIFRNFHKIRKVFEYFRGHSVIFGKFRTFSPDLECDYDFSVIFFILLELLGELCQLWRAFRFLQIWSRTLNLCED